MRSAVDFMHLMGRQVSSVSLLASENSPYGPPFFATGLAAITAFRGKDPWGSWPQ